MSSGGIFTRRPDVLGSGEARIKFSLQCKFLGIVSVVIISLVALGLGLGVTLASKRFPSNPSSPSLMVSETRTALG